MEFVLVVNQRSGKSSGCNVTKIRLVFQYVNFIRNFSNLVLIHLSITIVLLFINF